MRGQPGAGRRDLRILQLAVRALLRLAFRVRVHDVAHVPRSGAVLLAGNHTGFLDGPFIYLALSRPASFLVKAELYRIAPLGRLLDWAGQIPVHRGQPDRRALRGALAVLEAGGVVGVFPEGSRGPGTLDSVQHGVGYLALKSACTIVPVVCLGSSDALAHGRLVPRWRTVVDIVFGEPFVIEVAGDPRARSTVAAAAEQVRGRLLAHIRHSLTITGRTEIR